jgi:amino acid transporter
MEKKVTSTLTKGVIISLIVIIINIIGHYANLALESWFGWVGLVIFLAAIIWSVLSYGKQMDDNATFGNLFAHGFKVSATIACITFVYTLLSVYVLFPEFIDQIVEKGIEQARKEGKATEEQLQQGIGLVRKITTITLLAGSVLGTLVVGVIASLIGAAIAKKNPQSPFENQS